MNYQQSISERRHFLQLSRNQQHRAAAIAHCYNLSMNELDCANIDSPCWLRNQQQLRRQFEFSANNQLLLVPPGQRTRGQHWIWWAHIKIANDLFGSPLNCSFIQQHSIAVYRRLAIVNTEDGVLCQTEIKQQAATMPVFRHVSNAQFLSFPRFDSRDVAAFESDFA